MRGRALIRWLIVITAVAGMMLAPVVTWPSSASPSPGSPVPARVPTAGTGPAHHGATSGPSDAEVVREHVTPPELAAPAV